jgi:hypothetical protein
MMGDDRIILNAIATDNLISRNGARIPASELQALTRFLNGKPAITDHALYAVSTAWGRIVATALESANAPLDLSEENRAIVANEGYWRILCEIAVEPGHPVLKDIDFERVGELSITFLYTDMRCPGCTCGENVWSRNCPNDFWELPHYERHGVIDAFEISLVVVPAVKSAKILR